MTFANLKMAVLLLKEKGSATAKATVFLYATKVDMPIKVLRGFEAIGVKTENR